MIETAADIAKDVRQRARSQRTTAWIALSLVVLTIVAGAMVFVSAGYIATLEEARSQELVAVQAARLREQEEVVSKSLARATTQLEAELRGNGKTGAAGAGAVARQLEREIKDLQDELKLVRSSISNINAREARETAKELLTPQFVTTTANRILVVILLVFLVKILSGVYVYATRMTAHYESVADAIILTHFGADDKKLAAILDQTSPNRLAFPGQAEVNSSVLSEVLKTLASFRAQKG